MPAPNFDVIVSLAKRRGFVFPSSEIYGGMAGFWDYGPLGVELKNNVKAAWWRHMVHLRDDVVGIDAAIIMNPRVWEASGHVAGFSDPMVDCRNCKLRFRTDDLKGDPAEIACPNCGQRGTLTEPR
ncbi:MAG: glycine--tRNA ligase, partial [Chloroflexota bacterium]|nr:glycine--tRNA ligase [Chloroflexota bacterium]